MRREFRPIGGSGWRSRSTARGKSATRATAYGLPLSIDSSSAKLLEVALDQI